VCYKASNDGGFLTLSITINNRLCDNDAEAIEVIRSMVHKLRPDWTLPHRFFEERSEISGALTRVLRIVAREPRQLGFRLLAGGNASMPVRAAGASLAAPRAAAVQMAARVFTVPVAAPVARQMAFPEAERWVLARERRRHRYPMPPRRLNVQAVLVL
jgi:hypothetical protein